MLVQAFINTHFDLEEDWGADVLSSPAALARWLDRHGLGDGGHRPSQDHLAHAIALREQLRGLAARNGNGNGTHDVLPLAELNAAAAGAPSEVRFDADGPRFVAGAGGVAGALGALLAMTAAAMIDGSWSRLKICPGEHCGWAFYDHSRNQSGRWCSMAVCGGRAKARAHYWRRRSRGAD
jgi:predicted RNA-binding Zn ribbon-like protein